MLLALLVALLALMLLLVLLAKIMDSFLLEQSVDLDVGMV